MRIPPCMKKCYGPEVACSGSLLHGHAKMNPWGTFLQPCCKEELATFLQRKFSRLECKNELKFSVKLQKSVSSEGGLEKKFFGGRGIDRGSYTYVPLECVQDVFGNESNRHFD